MGYDGRKFAELIGMMNKMKLDTPILGSVYILNPKVAKIMNKGIVPGAVVTEDLLNKIITEWKDPKQGKKLAIERVAIMGAIFKGLGYKGMHLGGIHQSFDTIGLILDQMKEIEYQWPEFKNVFDFPMEKGYYAIP